MIISSVIRPIESIIQFKSRTKNSPLFTIFAESEIYRFQTSKYTGGIEIASKEVYSQNEIGIYDSNDDFPFIVRDSTDDTVHISTFLRMNRTTGEIYFRSLQDITTAITFTKDNGTTPILKIDSQDNILTLFTDSAQGFKVNSRDSTTGLYINPVNQSLCSLSGSTVCGFKPIDNYPYFHDINTLRVDPERESLYSESNLIISSNSSNGLGLRYKAIEYDNAVFPNSNGAIISISNWDLKNEGQYNPAYPSWYSSLNSTLDVFSIGRHPAGGPLTDPAFFSIKNNGNVGIGTTTQSEKLEVNGNIKALQLYSDILRPATEAILNIKTFSGVNAISVQLSGNVNFSGSIVTGNTFFTDRIRPTSSGGNLIFQNNSGGVTIATLTNTGNVGIGVSSPTTKLHLPAGTSTLAPLKIPSGTVLTSTENGVVEADSNHIYWTDSSGTRKQLDSSDSTEPPTITTIDGSNATAWKSVYINSYYPIIYLGTGYIVKGYDINTVVGSGRYSTTAVVAGATLVGTYDFPNLQYATGILASSTSNRLNYNFPELIASFTNFGQNSLTPIDSTTLYCPKLQVVSNLLYLFWNVVNLPELVYVNHIQTAGNCYELQLPKIVCINGIFQTSGNTTATLTIVNLGNTLKKVEGSVILNLCSLNQASVDNILERLAGLDGTNGTTSYSTRTVTLTGTSSAPSAAGLIHKATLEARGCTVTVNT